MAKRLKHGMTKSPTYNSWDSAKGRCTRPSMANYHKYGGRGIRMCERWASSFEAFLADMGPRPNGTTLDRIDNAKGYEPGNCRWATGAEQSLNQRRARKLTQEDVDRIRAIGRAKPAREVAAMFGVCHSTVQAVLNGRRL